MTTSVTALISEPGGAFRIERLTGSDSSLLAALQKAVGGYIEAVTGEGFVAYINEEGKLTGLPPNSLSTQWIDRLVPGFAQHDTLVGNVVWLGPSTPSGNEASISNEQVTQFSLLAMSWVSEDQVVVVRWHEDVWVYDTPRSGPTLLVNRLVTEARDSAEHGVIEVYPGITPPTWVELRAEILDNPNITVHDEREDRSYG